MTFKEKIKQIMDIKGINNRDLANKIGVDESLISRWINKDEPSFGFINHLVKLYPDVDLNFLMKNEVEGKTYKPLFEENVVYDDHSGYKNLKSNHELVEEIEQRLAQLKKNLAQISHK